MGGTKCLKDVGTGISKAITRIKCVLSVLECRKHNLILNSDQSVQYLECPNLC